MLRDRLRRLGPIAWRDARIAELNDKLRRQERHNLDKQQRRNARIAELKAEIRAQQQSLGDLRQEVAELQRYRPDVPSWHARIMEQHRVQRAVNPLDDTKRHPRRSLFRKLHNYEVARSHGVATPQVFGTWPDVSDVPWDLLPAEFVLKSNSGSTARGVLPLERVGSGFRLVAGTRTYQPQEIAAHFEQARGAGPPYFAETLLAGTGELLPDDIKIFAFYGEIAYVMIRRMPVHADLSQNRARMVTATGEHLDVVQRTRPSDADVPVPDQLSLMVETAAALSLAVPLPFIRVDVYATDADGLVLGELTPLPGDSHTFTREWDRRLGQMYDEAEARLQADLASGRPFGVLYGEHDRTLTTSHDPTIEAPPAPRW